MSIPDNAPLSSVKLLPRRIVSALEAAGYTTAGQVRQLTWRDAFRVRRIGRQGCEILNTVIGLASPEAPPTDNVGPWRMGEPPHDDGYEVRQLHDGSVWHRKLSRE